MQHLIILFLVALKLFALDIEKPKTYDSQNIDGWYMSEKLDGIRAYWDGTSLYTKNGNKIYTPKNFTSNFPKFKLDGELWTKRDDFENIQNIVLDKTPSEKWSQITYNIFESPYSKGNFIQRLKNIEDWFEKNKNPFVNIIPQYICKNEKTLNSFLEKIVSKNGEGVIIKNPNLEYINKRTSNSLKVKKFYDMEGLIIGINHKQTKVKSYILKLKNGVVFNLGNGFARIDKKNIPKIGDTVTFKYYSLTKNGKPKFASFLRIRKEE